MESRMVRYILYALGEIALVVIGILIALYLDGQKDYREDRRQELVYLREFRSDLERNLEELDRVILKSGSVVTAGDSVIAFSQRADGDIPVDSLLGYMEGLMGYTKHMTQQGTLQDIFGSGRLEVIRNDSIRRTLATWEADLKLIRELEVDSKKSFEKFVEYLNQNLPIYKQPDPDYLKKVLLPRMHFLNLVMDRAITTDFLHETYLEMKPRWKTALKTTEREIQRLQDR